jgi:hypothetical protein
MPKSVFRAVRIVRYEFGACRRRVARETPERSPWYRISFGDAGRNLRERETMQQATLEDANFFAEPNFLDFETEGLTSNIAQDSNVPDLPYLGEQDARPQIQPSQYAHTSGQNVGLASVSANPGLHSRAAHASHAPQTQTPQLRSGAAQNDARPTYTGNSDQIMSTRQGNISGANHSSNTTRVYSSRIPNHSHNNGPYTRETVHETFSPNTILESYQNNVPASAAAQTRPSFTLHQRKIPASSGTGISDSPVSSRAHFSKGLKAYRLQAALQNADLRFRQLEDQ